MDSTLSLSGYANSVLEVLALLQNMTGIVRSVHARAPGVQLEFAVRGAKMRHLRITLRSRVVVGAKPGPALRGDILFEGVDALGMLFRLVGLHRLQRMHVDIVNSAVDVELSNNIEVDLTHVLLGLARHTDEARLNQFLAGEPADGEACQCLRRRGPRLFGGRTSSAPASTSP